jgi:hypothetical protein
LDGSGMDDYAISDSFIFIMAGTALEKTPGGRIIK